jgi:hypothetical protein
MVQRISVSISDGLHERLQAVKDSLNVSGICQEAIMNAVQFEEAKQGALSKIDELIEKLKTQKEEARKQWGQDGKSQGMEDALELDYDDFVTVEKASEFLQTTDGGRVGAEEALGDDLAGRGSALCDLLDELEKDNKSFDRDVYLDGWIDGVLEVWEQVKAKI